MEMGRVICIRPKFDVSVDVRDINIREDNAEFPMWVPRIRLPLPARSELEGSILTQTFKFEP